jgi:hypothetical protein
MVVQTDGGSMFTLNFAEKQDDFGLEVISDRRYKVYNN